MNTLHGVGIPRGDLTLKTAAGVPSSQIISCYFQSTYKNQT